ncbi:autotransporter outer membrane beta-barrel domain-containing protein [Pseudomonas japonica]|uniref:Outer membrane autotransporter barrel domain-containing protein n=1 Tax=Pseudomonas japonica TaxID=256466 RepID=A0A239GQI1_9PSED|nr:autotransporter outer membrane beta-barrel domain-containing protein [Pseudomonas japonica]SNS71489.1 outer membrane autotransporter barrel domain-containing protein [Pseudomonas japonica]
MTATPRFRMRPLVRVLKLMTFAPLVLLADHAQGREQIIDENTPLKSYRIADGAKLISNGASTLDIRAGLGSMLDLKATTVTATGARAGVTLIGGEARIGGGSLITSERQGLVLGRTGSTGSSAWVDGSTVIGATVGAGVSTYSSLNLQGSQVIGSGDGSLGIELFGGTLNASASQISGASHGLYLRPDDHLPGTTAKVILDGTRVEGRDGAAIVVGSAFTSASGDIEVRNGSTLLGGDGVLIQAQAGSSASVRVDDSHLDGDIVAEEGAALRLVLQNRATLSGQLHNVEHLALNSQAQWNLVADGEVAELAMDGGSIRFGDAQAFHRLTLGNLSGNGHFIMDADFATGQTDFLEITGSASGTHTVLVGSSGADPAVDGQLHLIHAAAGDAAFSLVNGEVDLGTFSYDLVQNGNDWYLDASLKTISPATQSVLSLFNAAPTVWYGELSSLRSRMGELRLNGAQAGGWVRSYGNKYRVDSTSGAAYEQVQHGVSLGADAPLPVGDGQWLVGLMAGHSRSELSLRRGSSGTVDSYYAGAYATWLDQHSGYYFDGVLKFNRLQNASTVMLSDGQRTQGDYASHALGSSLEFGRHLALDDGWFVEPYTQLAALVVEGQTYALDNGLQADGERTRSLLGKVGSSFGRTFELGAGRKVQPYVRLAYAHEFATGNEVRVNDNVFANDLSGSRGEVGAGVAVALVRGLQLHADFDYSHGQAIEQPWGANLGLRYDW